MSEPTDGDAVLIQVGPLATALAKAQLAFPVITRDKEVTVKTKTGGSYTFKYATLEAILAAVREPLAANGIALTQLIDGDALETILMHESGAYLSARTRLADSPDIQAFGSAITYLRRYAIQAMLAIAAEEDDDGNRAAGNTISVKPDVERGDDGSLIGTAEAGKSGTSDFLLYPDPDRGNHLSFRLRGAKGGILVRTFDPLASQLFDFRDAIIGTRVTVWGRITTESYPAAGRKPETSFEVLTADRVRVVDIGDLPVAVPADAPSYAAGSGAASDLTEAESEAIWDEVERLGV